MKKVIGIILLSVCSTIVTAQETLSLDSCRAMALRNNKQLRVSSLKREVAKENRKALRTKYFPRVDALGTYQYFNKEISLLTSDQKYALNNLGSLAMGGVEEKMGAMFQDLIKMGVDPQIIQKIATDAQGIMQPVVQKGNALGNAITDALRTDTHNMWGGTINLRQPIFLGGGLIAANKMASIAEEMAADMYDGDIQNTLYRTDETYWLVVSLKQKQKLAQSFVDLLHKLDSDVQKLIDEGIATRSTGLKVAVRVNEAEMALTKVDNGLTLSRMLLCQMIGLPLDTDIALADEESEGLDVLVGQDNLDGISPFENRSEVKMLTNMVEMSKQTTNMVRALSLPQVMLTGGYIYSNPNTFNGFQNKFDGVWNIGVAVRVPLVNWVEGIHQVRATKTATIIANMELADVKEKIDLQVTQSRFKMKEAQKRLEMANKNVASAEENLRCANIGFREGVMETTDVMQAQTAWQEAHSAKIDAEIDVRMAQINLRKSLGILE